MNDKKLAAGYVLLIDDKGDVCAAADVLRVIENYKNAKLSCSCFWINKEFMPVAEPATGEPATGEEVLRRVWDHSCAPYKDQDLSLERTFIVDESVPGAVIEFAGELKLTSAQIDAALDYWRSAKLKAIDEVWSRYKQEALQRPTI